MSQGVSLSCTVTIKTKRRKPLERDCWVQRGAPAGDLLLNICPALSMLQKDFNSGMDASNESNRIKASCGLQSLKTVGKSRKLPVWHLALCVPLIGV